MVVMLVRNLVEDYAKWKKVFDAHAARARDAGLRLTNLWRSVEDPNNVFFIFEVEDMERAKEFLNDPASAEAGEVSGVIEGEFYFLEGSGL